MDERTLFSELLQDMLEQAQINGNRISQAEIQEYFEDLKLSEEQMNHIYAYLVAHRITVQGFVPGADTKQVSRQYQTFGMLEEAREEKERAEKAHRREPETKTGMQVTSADKNTELTSEKTTKTESDSAFLKMYLRELRVVEKLTKGQERELAEQLLHLAGAVAANEETGFVVDTVADELLAELKERFVHHKLRGVVKQARTYASGGELLDELVQEGNIGLLTALQRLEQYQEADAFLAFVEEQIVRAMEAYLDEAYAKDGEAQAMVAKVHFVSEAAKKLKEENGQEPTLAELAACTNLTEEELLAIVNLSPENLRA